MHAMHSLIYHNDRIIDLAEARISPTTAGLVYGWGVFTTLRVYDGRAFAFERHWDRLLIHGDKARIPVLLSVKEAKRAIEQLISESSIREGKARLMFLKGDAGGGQIKTERESEF